MLFKTIMPQSLCDSFSVHNAFNCQNSGIFMQLLDFLKFICPQQFWKFLYTTNVCFQFQFRWMCSLNPKSVSIPV